MGKRFSDSRLLRLWGSTRLFKYPKMQITVFIKSACNFTKSHIFVGFREWTSVILNASYRLIEKLNKMGQTQNICTLLFNI